MVVLEGQVRFYRVEGDAREFVGVLYLTGMSLDDAKALLAIDDEIKVGGTDAE